MVSRSEVDNVFSFVKWRGDLELPGLPLSEEDQLVFAILSYVNFSSCMDEGETLTLSDAARRMISSGYVEDDYRTLDDFKFLSIAAFQPRYSNLLISDPVNRFSEGEERQFFAITFHLPDDTKIISYRGTDMSLAGWKEDFNMSFEDTVPAQADALSYLTMIAGKYDGKIVLTGHSKGGNLSIYSALNAPGEIQGRIWKVFNNDGPGFNEESPTYGKLKEYKGQITTIVPSSSIIGMLLEHLPEYKVVESSSSGIFQHDPYSWVFDAPGLKFKESLDKDSLISDRILRGWIRSIGKKEREEFVDALFSIFGNAGIKTFRIGAADLFTKGPEFVRAYIELPAKEKKILYRTVKKLFQSAGSVLFDMRLEGGDRGQDSCPSPL